MTDCIGFSRRLIIISAALLAAAAVALVLGVIPPVRSDTFRQAAPDPAAAAFLIQAAVAFLAAIALAISAARAADRPRSAIAILQVIGALVFLLGEGLKLPATVPAAEYVAGLIVAVVLGGYSLLATCLLSRGLPRASGNLWIVLAMNALLLLAALIALLVEPNKSAALQVLGIAILSCASSYGGLALATRATRPPVVPTN